MRKMKGTKWKNRNKEYKLQAVLTVELTYIFIVLFSIFIVIIHTVFYYHDKNILQGAANETAVLWAQLERKQGDSTETSPETFYQGRIKGKLLLFTAVSVNVEQTEEEICVLASAEKGFMKVSARSTAVILKPEDKIRKKRILEEWIE